MLQRHSLSLLAGLLALSTGVGPATAQAAANPAPRAITAATTPASQGHLTVDVEALADGRHRLIVIDARTGRRWVGEDERREAARLIRAERVAEGWDLEIETSKLKTRFQVKVRFDGDDRLQFHIDNTDRTVPFPELPYPPAFRAELTKGSLLFCDRASGIMLPQTDEWHRNKVRTTYGNTDALDMPWIGVVDEATGEGAMAIMKTPVESAIRFVPDRKGRIWPQVQWFEVKGTFTYARQVDYIFIDKGGYMAQALRYRIEAERDGLLEPLHERVKRNPHVDWARGAAVIWGSPGSRTAREYRTYGIRHGILNAHGAIPPDEIREMTAMGFLSGEYDSYTDIREGPTGRQSDSIEEAAYRMADGSPSKGWRTPAGIQFYNRSSALALRAASIVVPGVLATYPYTSRFIDVSPSLNFLEDHHPQHSFDRRQDMKNRQALFDYVRDLGLVMGGEHPKAWAARFFEYGEGNLSGGHWWKNAKAGNLQRLDSRDEIPEPYFKYGINHAIRVPLWDVVFHDTIIPTWYWGDSNGYLHNVAPEISDWKDVATILNGGAPLMWADHLCYGWDRNRDRFRQTARNTTHFARRVAYSRLATHEFLNADRSVQMSRFADPTGWAVVNFVGEPRQITIEGREYALAPYGFHAEADGLVQSRLSVGEDTVTTISGTDYFFREASTPGSVGPLNVSGRGELVMMDEGRWNVLLRSESETRINLTGIGSLAASPTVRLSLIEASGRRIGTAAFRLDGREIVLPPTGAEEQLMALDINIDRLATVSHPDGGMVSDDGRISLVGGPDAARIVYTLDGGDPIGHGVIYTEPFRITRSLTLRARTFDAAGNYGPEFTTQYQLEKLLHDTQTVTAGISPVSYTVDLTGVEKLHFEVTDAGDGLDFDACDLVDMKLFRVDGSSVSLTSLTPLLAVQSSDKPVFNGDQMKIGGRKYADGIYTHAMSKYAWSLKGEFVRLEGLVGINDRTNGNGSIRLTISGTY